MATLRASDAAPGDGGLIIAPWTVGTRARVPISTTRGICLPPSTPPSCSRAHTGNTMLSFAVASCSFVAPGSLLSTQVSRGASVSMGSTADFKNGLTLEDENSVWKITSFLHVRWHVHTAVFVVPQLTTPALRAAAATAATAAAAAAAAAAVAAAAVSSSCKRPPSVDLHHSPVLCTRTAHARQVHRTRKALALHVHR